MGNNIPQGYKATALGIIPQEWKTIRLKDCFSISAGGDVQKDCFSEAPSLQYKYPIYSNSLFNHGLYGFTSHPRHKANSITITGRGALGHAEYREIDFDAIVRLLVLAPKIPLNGQYITEYINFRKPFFYESTGVPQLTAPQIANIQVLFPPLGEQRKIAEVLGVWDEAIEKQARLIEKLALRKRALMQRLLSAKLRLPGFSEPWKKVKLGDVAELYQPQTIQSEDLSQTGYPVYGANGLIGYYNNYNHEYPQVVITCRGSSCGTVNFTPGKCWITGNAMVLNVDNNRDVNKSFFYYLISNSSFVNLISGSGQPQIVRQPLLKFELRIPPLKEQTAIAEVLTAADREIDLAKEKLERLRRQKRGLMQQLLTGKKRI